MKLTKHSLSIGKRNLLYKGFCANTILNNQLNSFINVDICLVDLSLLNNILIVVVNGELILIVDIIVMMSMNVSYDIHLALLFFGQWLNSRNWLKFYVCRMSILNFFSNIQKPLFNGR